MRAYSHPQKGNEDSGSAYALDVYCNEYGKIMHSVKIENIGI